MGCILRFDHPLMRWIVEHATNTYNKYAMTPHWPHPYATFIARILERNLLTSVDVSYGTCRGDFRAKLDLRWQLGVYVKYAISSHDYCLAIPNGNVDKSRSVVPSRLWHKNNPYWTSRTSLASSLWMQMLSQIMSIWQPSRESRRYSARRTKHKNRWLTDRQLSTD